MNRFIFRQATAAEMPCIIAMQREIFSGEQGIPEEMIDVFMEMDPPKTQQSHGQKREADSQIDRFFQTEVFHVMGILDKGLFKE